MRLPKEFESKMFSILGEEEYEAFMSAFEQNKLQGFRINTLKISVDDFLKICPFKVKPIPWCKEGFYYEGHERPAKHPYYHAGLYYIQEPSAMAPVSVLKPTLGDKVLDLCAAPGGKTVQIAAALGDQGLLISNDINLNRIKAVIKNIELYGIKNAIVVNENPEKLSRYFKEYFDKILVDAPCSGEGMFRKDPSLIKSWEKYGDDYYPDIQNNIMNYMTSMLKSGGKVLYSTCTFSPKENEGIINAFLNNNDDFYLLEIPRDYGISRGVPKWVNGDESLAMCGRLWPHKIDGEGHFLALLEKKSTSSLMTEYNEEKICNTDPEFKTFVEENLTISIEGILEKYNDQLYLVPDMPPHKGLKILRSGWLLGTLKKNRFEPSQALAMGLKKDDVKRSIDFSVNDSRVVRYLKGETLDIEGEKGWTLVCVDGYPLGWGKQMDNGLKNYYPPSWRWLD